MLLSKGLVEMRRVVFVSNENEPCLFRTQDEEKIKMLD
jgi:hypothetical protein